MGRLKIPSVVVYKKETMPVPSKPLCRMAAGKYGPK